MKHTLLFFYRPCFERFTLKYVRLSILFFPSLSIRLCVFLTLSTLIIVVYMFIKYSLTTHSFTPYERFTCCEGEFKPIPPHCWFNRSKWHWRYIARGNVYTYICCVGKFNKNGGEFVDYDEYVQSRQRVTLYSVMHSVHTHTRILAYDLFVFGESVSCVLCVNISTARCDGMYVTVVAVISSV